MNRILVPCPHSELCGVMSHEYGSVASIECLTRIVKDGYPTNNHYLLAQNQIAKSIEYEGPLSTMCGLLSNSPDGYYDHLRVIGDVLRAEPDHARLLHLGAGYLNANFPQVKHLDTYDDQYGFVQEPTCNALEWISPDRIVQTAPYTQWGYFWEHAHRSIDWVYDLASSFSEEDYQNWVKEFSKHPVCITAISGPVGPIYRSVDVEGAHRIFVARVLRLPAMIANVYGRSSLSGPQSYSEVFDSSMLITSSESSTITKIESELTDDVPTPTIQNLRIAIAQVEATILEYSDDMYLMIATSESPWLLFPESARLTELAYILAYPGYESKVPEIALSTDAEFNSWVDSASH